MNSNNKNDTNDSNENHIDIHSNINNDEINNSDTNSNNDGAPLGSAESLVSASSGRRTEYDVMP